MEVSRTRETVSTVGIEKEAVIKTEKETEIPLADFHGVLRVQAKESDPDIDRGMTVSPGLTEVLCEVIIVLVSHLGEQRLHVMFHLGRREREGHTQQDWLTELVPLSTCPSHDRDSL